MKLHRALFGIILLAGGAVSAQGALITFNATGNANVTGFVQFDDAGFLGGAFDAVSNTSITALSLTVFGAVFTLTDVVVGDSTFVDSSGVTPLIANGGGLLANNGFQAIAFFPDDFGGSGIDGDASLAFSVTPTFGPFTFHQVRWDVVPNGEVPEPSTLGLFGVGAGALALARRRMAR